MYEVTIKLIDGEVLVFQNVFCTQNDIKDEVESSSNFFTIDDFCIKKSEIKYVECKLKEEID